MECQQWLESVYSDGSALFVSDPHPERGQTVTVRIRMYADAPVRYVFLRCAPNGGERLIEMTREREEHALAYYAAQLPVTENRMHYHFYLVCDDILYYYTQKAVTTYMPDITYDFVLLADYVQPAWVKDAVFYQIFPERFCNGDASNDVKDGEYRLGGYETMHSNWDDPVLPYEQGHCVDFYGGDLQGVQEKIPYLKALGVTAVYLNPIFVAPSVHKYDCIDYFHVDPHFGGDEALAALSRALHENGMKLILDISINHTGSAHRWFNRDGLYFDTSEGAYHNPDAKERKYYFFQEGTDEYLGWYGVQSMPVLNYTSEQLRDIIYRAQDSVLRKWLKPPYSIDGWRFDVADVFARNNEVQLAHELWPQIRASIREVNPQAYILAEDWGDCAQYLQGREWDSAMNYYGFGRVIRQFLGEPDLFAHDPRLHVPYKMTAEDVEGRVMEHLAKLPFAIWQNQFNLFDSHDTPRLHNNPNVDPREYRGAVMMLFTFIGAANVYYGDEANIDGWPDGHEGCRYPMPWGKDFQSGDVYHLYRTMAHAKADHVALREGGMKFLYARGNVLAVARFTADEAVVTVMSTGDTDECIRLPLAAIGAKGVAGERDLFGTPIKTTPAADGKSVCMEVGAHQAYCFLCEMA